MLGVRKNDTDDLYDCHSWTWPLCWFWRYVL